MESQIVISLLLLLFKTRNNTLARSARCDSEGKTAASETPFLALMPQTSGYLLLVLIKGKWNFGRKSPKGLCKSFIQE